MKTLLLITLAAGLGFSANAQQDFGRSHNNDKKPMTRNYDNKRQLDMRIAAINNDYNNRVNALQHRPFMRAKERRKQIRLLEKERTMALQQARKNNSVPYASGYGKDWSGHDHH